MNPGLAYVCGIFSGVLLVLGAAYVDYRRVRRRVQVLDDAEKAAADAKNVELLHRMMLIAEIEKRAGDRGWIFVTKKN